MEVVKTSLRHVPANRLALGPSPAMREICTALDHGKPPQRLVRETTVMAPRAVN